MGDDWQPGDLALCIKLGPWRRMSSDGTVAKGEGPPAGRVLEVRSVLPGACCSIALKFSDWPDANVRGWAGYDAKRFRKIRPHQPDEEDAETIRLLNGAPVRQPA